MRFLDRVLEREIEVKNERRIATSLRLSGLPTGKTLEGFDFGFQPRVDRAKLEALVDDLRQVQMQHPDGSTFIEPGPYVEPVQLQVVCRRLWDAMPADHLSIEEEHLDLFGDVDDAVAQVAGGCLPCRSSRSSSTGAAHWMSSIQMTTGARRARRRSASTTPATTASRMPEGPSASRPDG